MKSDTEQINELNHLIVSVGEKVGSSGYLGIDEHRNILVKNMQPLPIPLPITKKMGSGGRRMRRVCYHC